DMLSLYIIWKEERVRLLVGSPGASRNAECSNCKHLLDKIMCKLVSLLADGSSSGRPSLSTANSAWIDQTLSLKTSFKQVLNNVYKATCKQVNFLNKPVEAVIEVNSWAEKQTNGLIKGVLPADAVSSEIRLILANAVHFKGTWKKEF
ncbi:serine protease inhibitor family protein, partial [Tanacetum coccineum]